MEQATAEVDCTEAEINLEVNCRLVRLSTVPKAMGFIKLSLKTFASVGSLDSKEQRTF